MNRRDRIVVVGGGLTGLRAAERLRELRYEGEIMIIGAERVPPYHRPALSKQLLMGTLQPSDLTLPAYEDIGAKWRLGSEVRYLLPRNRTLQLPGGEEITYDGLIIATGVEARRPNDVPYHDPRVLVLRTLRDALDVERMISSTRGPVAVVGGGFTGCELAASLRHMGREVTLIGRSPNLLGNVLGPALGDWLTDLHRDHGVDLALNTSVRQWSPTSEGVELRLADGSSMLAACVVVAAGTVPTTAWLRGSGLPLDNGVVCEPTCHVVGADDVVAAGDVAQWPNLRFDDVPRRVEHWLNAIEMGRAAAESLLAGRAAAEPFTPMPRFWTEQYGVRIQAAGMLKLGTDVITLGTADEGTGTVFGYSRGGRLMGVVGLDCPSSVLAWTETVSQQNPAPRPRVPAGAASRPAAAAPSRRRTGKHSLPAREKEKRGRPEERRKQTYGWVDGELPPVGVGRGPADTGRAPADAGRPVNAVDSFSRMLPVAVRKPAGADVPAGRPGWPAPLSGRLGPADLNGGRIPPPEVTEQLPPLDVNGHVRWAGPANPPPAGTNGRPVPRNSHPRPVEPQEAPPPLTNGRRNGHPRPVNPQEAPPLSRTDGRLVPRNGHLRPVEPQEEPLPSRTDGRLVPRNGHLRPVEPQEEPLPPRTNGRLVPRNGHLRPVEPQEEPLPSRTDGRLVPRNGHLRPVEPQEVPPPSRTNGRPVPRNGHLRPVEPQEVPLPPRTDGRLVPRNGHPRPVEPSRQFRPEPSHDRLPPVSRRGSGDRLPPPGRGGPADSFDRLPPVGRPGPDAYPPIPPAPRPGPADSYDRLPPASRPEPAADRDRVPPLRRTRAAARAGRRRAGPR